MPVGITGSFQSMTRTLTLTTLMFTLAALAGCAAHNDNHAAEQPIKIKHDPDEVPLEVRAIETLIERPGAIMAEEVEISVSKNYEWDVSLSGDFVSDPRRHVDGGTFSVAKGHACATFRKLEIRAWKRIVFRRSDLNVVPFIKITAKGRAAHATSVENGTGPVVRRAPVIKIRNADIEYLDAPGRSHALTDLPTVGPVAGAAADSGVLRD